jgi:fructoselysine and glucoselysine-specific PTS system IIA component
MGRKIVLVSHNGLAEGVLDAAAMICGQNDEMCAFGLAPDGSVAELGAKVRALAEAHRDDQVIVLADLLGGSVCNQCLEDLAGLDNVKIVAGLSLPLLLAIACRDGELSDEEIDEAVAEAAGMTKRVELELDAAPDAEEDFF